MAELKKSGKARLTRKLASVLAVLLIGALSVGFTAVGGKETVRADRLKSAAPAESVPSATENPYGDYDEDGDGVILEVFYYNGCACYMLKVLDPTRVFVSEGGADLTLGDQCLAHGARGGINAGGFQSDPAFGDGNLPDGLTVIDGQVTYPGLDANCFVGLDAEGRLVIGYYTADDVINMGLVGGVSFGPILIANGLPRRLPDSGINPRTAIGQREDGCILMLVIDGRQPQSYGASYEDLQEIMMRYGAFNAVNLDGGSATTMWLDGEYVNNCSAASGPLGIPNAFLFR